MFWQQFMFSLSVTGPICLVLLLGFYLRKIGFLNQGLLMQVSSFSRLPPILLFLSVSQSKQSYAEHIDFIELILLKLFIFDAVL